ncbi:MAG TPA: hypothetical protein VGV12_07660 [Gemmatimonadales bacterium]|nr:hypothetical protein [Gemmatimonadales bacterium]
MIALTTTRNRWTRSLAVLLLVLQGLAVGAVSLAHASERLTAPAHIEAQHGAACLALHDELRCAPCHWAGAQSTPRPTYTGPLRAGSAEGRRADPDAIPARRPDGRCAPPRAPPTPLP